MLVDLRRMLMVAGIAALAAGGGAADAQMQPSIPYRIVMLSNLPEVVTYQDQGFADFIRETKQVPTTSIDVAAVTRASLEAALNDASKSYSVKVELADTRAKTEREQVLSAEAVASWVDAALRRPDVDAVVVVGQGTTRFERFVKGVSMVTKIGLLGIEKLTMVFSMPEISIYGRASKEACSTTSSVRRTRIPAIYSKWADDMANGPSDAVHTRAQTAIAQELPLAIQEAVVAGGASIGACLSKARTASASSTSQ